MKQRRITVLLFTLFTINIYAGSPPVSGLVLEKANPELPVAGANIYWAGTTHGTTTNAEGKFILPPNGHLTAGQLVVSFVGFKPDTLFIDNGTDEIIVMLEKNIELDEVVVNERRKGVYISAMDPVQTHKVTTTELQKAACCNLSESFETNASVDVAYSDAVTGAKQIKMLGLSGIYVQTLSENMPLVRGMAAPYGLGYVPGPWMESSQISKGTSSVVNGYEAITGQINVEYKKPQGAEVFHFNLYGNEAMKSEANMNYTHKFNDRLATTLFVHGENQGKEIDLNGDRFLDMPNVRQINLMNRWNISPENGGHREIGVKMLDELRRSGQVGAFEENGSDLYEIETATRRYEVFAKNGILFNKPGTSLGVQFSGSYHNQQSAYGDDSYQGTQYSGYLNVIYMGNLGSDLHRFKAGASFLGDWVSESLNGNSFINNETVPGTFFEYNYTLNVYLNVLAGIRADYSTQYGVFVTPRLHVKWSPAEWLTIRGSGGKGYRKTLPLAENHYLLASSREIIVDDELEQEEAVNMGASLNLDIPLGEKVLTFMADYYHTRFLNQVVRDMDSDAHKVHFMNLNGESYSNTLQLELMHEIFNGFSVNAAWRLMDVKQTLNGELREMPLTSRYKGMVSLSYATRLEKWQFDLTGQFNGGGRMPDPDPVNPLWQKTYSPFTVVNAQITKRFRRWSLYAGVENLFNFTMQNPVIDAGNPRGPDFDGSMVWGPVHGRKIYAGIRYTLNVYE